MVIPLEVSCTLKIKRSSPPSLVYAWEDSNVLLSRREVFILKAQDEQKY